MSHLRAVLHDEGRWSGHRSRVERRAWDRRGARRLHQRRQRTRTREHILRRPSDGARMKPRALIVDDEQAECELFADALRHAGFDPQWVQDPLSALDVLGKRQFEVVVTDLNMPTMNGAELCRRVKEVLP